jgi:hypothetical protein
MEEKLAHLSRKGTSCETSAYCNAYFFLTVFKVAKRAFTQIDRFRRTFLWKGQDLDNVRVGHCLINWGTCTRLKRLGGLGIRGLEKFGRAPRMKWLWHVWDHKESPWKKLLKVSDPADRQLFFLFHRDESGG